MDERLARLDGAEPAGPRADIAEYHHRGGPLVPALAHVGAVGLLADRVELQAVEETPEVLIGPAGRDAGLDPLRVATRHGRTVGCRAGSGRTVGCRAGGGRTGGGRAGGCRAGGRPTTRAAA